METSTAAQIIEHATAFGCDFAEVFLEDRFLDDVRARDEQIVKVSSGRDIGAGIRVVHDGRTGFAHTADVTYEGLLRTFAAAAGAAGLRGAGMLLGVRRQASHAHLITGVPSYDAVDLKDTLRAAREAARGVSDTVDRVGLTVLSSVRRVAVLNSTGTHSSYETRSDRYVVEVTAAGYGRRETAMEAPGWTSGSAQLDLPVMCDAATTAARRSVRLLTAREAPVGDLPVVFAAGAGGVLFHEACGHGLEADLVARGASGYAGLLDSPVASPMVTLVDDGRLDSAWGSQLFDDEGEPTSRHTLIREGALVGFLDARHRPGARGDSGGSARRENYRHLPMPRMNNTFMLPGKDSPESLIRDTEYGIYCTQLGGGSVNTVTGEFSFAVTEGYLIERGEVTHPLTTFQLVGNGPATLRSIDAVANDFALWPGICGKDRQSVPVTAGQPTLRVRQMTIAGGARG
ncbi:TldD/PmbA family protein [Couchioplanes caeruleus]|uniref:TldD protein n=2 Tax=Couchioplanes caeruleus TaxID=56438 RepID=A0A1K0GUF9_9ACTN|nr:TldD/PmbA family protein [Couchioplanes caeruleus]OJF12987.1 hypothetical protein BG844_17595 [Couchioplanes caeruleus subsp. caeruleus]ROP33625.1 TldD protein [Couchioplanes caeruleus]